MSVINTAVFDTTLGRVFFVFTIFTSVGCGGANPNDKMSLHRTVDDPEAHVRGEKSLVSGSSYRFALGFGDGSMGYNTLSIHDDMSATYVFMEPKPVWDASLSALKPVWHRASFVVSANEYADLRQQLIEAGFYSLRKEYHAHVVDGEQVTVTLLCDDDRKTVYCNNFFPEPIQKLRRFSGDLIKAHDDEVRLAPEVEYDHEWAESELSLRAR